MSAPSGGALDALGPLWAELGIPHDYAVRRGLSIHQEATDLVVAALAPDDGTEVRLTPPAAAAWRRLDAAAKADGVVIWPLSGFRSVARQAEIIRRKRLEGQAISEILRLVAAPGCSEHHSGRALDVGTPNELILDESFAMTAAYRWLERHAGEFGFVLSYPRGNASGIEFEPWHWCFGLNAARSI